MVGRLFGEAVSALARVLYAIVLVLGYNFGSASVLEITWTALASIGFPFAVAGLVFSMTDIAELHADPTYLKDGPRDIVVTNTRRNSIIRIVFFLGALPIGFLAMITPSAHPAAPPTPYAIGLGLWFVIMDVGMTYGAIKDQQGRRKLIAAMRRRRAGDRDRFPGQERRNS